ncbi:MAG: 5-oxoprolinase subunit PxpA [Halioglobus sp.]|nr:5-oxoprolinase subunit PxpA [Halioglobus sp.]
MLLNCDLGEEAGTAGFNPEAAAMPYIDQANIACGVHAGSERVMRETAALAARHGVAVGAHPSYPDRENFGRTSMNLAPAELQKILHTQIQTLEDIATAAGTRLSYVKPHGALYNDMMADQVVRSNILQAVASYRTPLALMLLCTADADRHRTEARALGVNLILEAFADRAYTDSGTLVPRDIQGAVHDAAQTLAQVQQLCADGSITTLRGTTLQLEADTLCVHGDNPEGVAMIRRIRNLLDAH